MYKEAIKQFKNQLNTFSLLKDSSWLTFLEEHSELLFILPQVLIILMGMAFISITYMAYYQWYLREQKEQQLKRLKAYVNPHFISNSLNAIEYLINYDKKKEASRALVHFARFYRLLLNNFQLSENNLHNELTQIKHFLALQQLRFRGKFNYFLEVDPAINLKAVLIPTMLLQPYLENAIWYGLKPKKSTGNLLISLKKERNHLICEITDDGIGRAAALVLQDKSVLKQLRTDKQFTKERLIAPKLKKGVEVEMEDLFDLDQKPIGTKVIIRLQLSTQKLTKKQAL